MRQIIYWLLNSQSLDSEKSSEVVSQISGDNRLSGEIYVLICQFLIKLAARSPVPMPFPCLSYQVFSSVDIRIKSHKSRQGEDAVVFEGCWLSKKH